MTTNTSVLTKSILAGAVLVSSIALQARSPKLPDGFPSNGTVTCQVSYAEQLTNSFDSVEGTYSTTVLKGNTGIDFNLRDIKDWKPKYGSKQIPKTISDPHFVSFRNIVKNEYHISARIVKADANGESIISSSATANSKTNTAEVDVNIYSKAEDQILTLGASCTFVPES